MGSYGYSSHHNFFAGAIKRNLNEYALAYKSQNTDEYSDIIQEYRTIIFLLITTYLEALINLYLCFKVEEAGFLKYEYAPLKEKWCTVPKNEFNDAYTLSGDADLETDLKALIDKRNTITHMKPEIVIDGEVIHAGKPLILTKEDHDIILKWSTLPRRLVKNLGGFYRSEEFSRFF